MPLARRAVISPLLANIRDKTKRTRGDRLALVIADLNRTLRGWLGTSIHKTWPNAYFAGLGLFALQAAWATARQSR